MWRRTRGLRKTDDPTVSEAPDRSRSSHQAHFGPCPAREVHSPRAHLDPPYLVGAQAACRLPRGHLCGPLAGPRRSAVPAGFSRQGLKDNHRIRQRRRHQQGARRELRSRDMDQVAGAGKDWRARRPERSALERPALCAARLHRRLRQLGQFDRDRNISKPAAPSRRLRTRRLAESPERGRLSWTRLLAAVRFRSKPCALVRTHLPVTSIRCRSC